MSPFEPRLQLVPPGPVTDKTRLELRLAVPESTGAAMRIRLWIDDEPVLDESRTPPTLARAWWPTQGKVGKHKVRWSVERPGIRRRGSAALTVVGSPTVGQPRFSGAWIEPGAAIQTAPDTTPAGIEKHIRASVDAMHALGIRFLILAYAEAGGVFYYPSRLTYMDRAGGTTAVPLPTSEGANQKTSTGGSDVYGIVLSQAQKRGMAVFVGLSRGGDMHLLWEFDKPGWTERNAVALRIGEAMAHELHARYGHYRSFYGWYFTHEVSDLAKAAAYYDPLARYCRALAPERVVLIAPSGTPIGSREIIARSEVDIICYQDAVGTGYIPYQYTWNPERRIAMLEEIFTRYQSWHEGTDKHIWSDLEVWEMDGKSGYTNPYPPSFARVKRQLEIEAAHVPVLTAYAWHGYLHPPLAKGKVDLRARTLYQDYETYLRQRP